jgi:DNA-binding HxlR family transcriptional regulator
MARRYDQYCALATALDMVGDRWSLLVVRELLVGPRRYGDLLVGIPGIPTDMLATRLRQLEAESLVQQVSDTSDGRARIYRLTVEGRRLEESVLALARVGLRHLGRDAGKAFRPQWLGLAVRALFRPGAITGELRVRFVVGEGHWQVRIDADEVTDDPHGEPDVTVSGGPSALVDAIRDDAALRTLIDDGSLHISGSRDDLRRLGKALTRPNQSEQQSRRRVTRSG